MRTRSVLEGGLAQGLPSLLNFIVALWLISRGSLEEFGVYSFLFAVSALISGVQRPLVSLPMSVFATRSHVADHYADFFTFHLVALAAGLLVAALVGVALHAPEVAFVLYAVSQQCREFVKTYLFSVQERRAAMHVEVIASVVFLALMGSFHLAGDVSVSSALLVGAGSASTFVWPWLRIRRRLERQRRRRFRWKRYLYIWRFAKWSVAGALANEVTTRSYNYLVAWFAGFELLGLINFVRQLYAPVQLLSNAWSQISLPVQREHYVSERPEAARRMHMLASAGFVAVTLGWTAALYLATPLMQRWKSDLDTPLLPVLLALWCVYYLIDCQLILYLVEFHLRRRFRFLFNTGFACAVATLAISVPVVLWLPETWLVGVASMLNAALLLVYFTTLRREADVPSLAGAA